MIIIVIVIITIKIIENILPETVQTFIEDFCLDQHFLWKFLRDRYGTKIASTMIPYSVDLTDKNELEDFNEYTMICDHFDEKNILCYVNGFVVGRIEYGEDIRESYKNCFYCSSYTLIF